VIFSLNLPVVITAGVNTIEDWAKCILVSIHLLRTSGFRKVIVGTERVE
jgi:hypothetical protein